ncbi:MAG: iron chelate uptake ABC transporter family permease subunit, partial [Anaerococcus sp.]|nr:iron chelate uptake ABC transporter family permease subunit [Anaerococcus sp.]
LSLIAVAILISISTALVGPMTFYGFLVATLTYELAKTYDHKYLLLMAILLAFVILSGSYFIMNHIFNANGVVSVLIELIGGIAFLMLIFKEEKL